ncbi:MAG: hypothetical protein HN403_05110 [Rhodospirillales bacterium]|jgi:hypothetical protein|nr:hypothetical protein [Rhodospirillales bacterium]
MRVVGIALIFFSAVIFCRPLLAVEKSGADMSDNPHVKLLSFLAPGLNSKGNRVQLPMTLVFEVSKETDVKRFCSMSPRIQDAIMREMFKKPVRVKKGWKIDRSDIAVRLTSVANGALGKTTIVETHVYNKIVNYNSKLAKSAAWKVCNNR